MENDSLPYENKGLYFSEGTVPLTLKSGWGTDLLCVHDLYR